MYRWWEIVVYYEGSIQSEFPNPPQPSQMESHLWFAVGSEIRSKLSSYVDWRIQAHIRS